MYCIVSADIFFPNPHSEVLVCQDVRLDLVSFLYEVSHSRSEYTWFGSHAVFESQLGLRVVVSLHGYKNHRSRLCSFPNPMHSVGASLGVPPLAMTEMQ
jgi:hypothetical protein